MGTLRLVTLETGSFTGMLNDEDRRRFEADGYLVVRDICSLDLIDALRDEFEGILNDPWHEGPQVDVDGVVYTRYTGRGDDWYWHRVKNAWKTSDSARALALNPKVLSVTEELFERKVKPFQTLNFGIGTNQLPHSDSFHFQSDPPGFMCGAWVALEDMDMDNGPLVYYPGSHKLPIPTWDEIDVEMGETLREENYGDRHAFLMARGLQYEQYCQRLIDRENLEPEYALVSKGEAVLWAPNLLHGGSPQRDSSRTRHSQVTHYFFEGCRVFTPLHTDDGHNYWNYPEWIRDPVPAYSPQLLRETITTHVPEGSKVLFYSAGVPLPDLDGRHISHFPANEDGKFVPPPRDEASVDLLEQARSEGFDFVVFPKEHLTFLEYGLPPLQRYLEDRYTAILRDGAVCAIYALT